MKDIGHEEFDFHRALHRNIISIVKTNKMHPSIKFILFWNDTLHVSDGLSVHHQEFKTIHTATGICRTNTAVCLLASRQQYLYDKCLLLYV